jgi:hypothetical protein
MNKNATDFVQLLQFSYSINTNTATATFRSRWSHVAIDGQSVSVSWYLASSLITRLYYCFVLVERHL